MANASDHCERLVRETDKDRYLATLFAPADKRASLLALYAFDIEVARTRDVIREPMAGEIRLQWWREVFEGERAGEAAAHPVASALVETLDRYQLPREGLLQLLEARSFDLYDDPMGNFGELAGYATRTRASILDLAARILGAPLPEPLVSQIAMVQTIASILTVLPLNASRRQLYIPLDLLALHNANSDHLFAGKVTPQLGAALAEMRIDARKNLDAVRDAIDTFPAAALPAVLPLALIRPLLGRMERQDYDPLQPPRIPAWRRQWLLWRAAHNPRRIA